MEKKEIKKDEERTEEKVELNLFQKLIEIRKVLPYFKKDTKGYGYSYVQGTVILSAIKDKMNELGLLLFPTIIDHKTEQIEIIENKTKVPNILIDAKIDFIWIDSESKEELIVPFAGLHNNKDSAQGLGGLLTYTERYFLMKFFNIPTDEDDPDVYIEKIENLKKDLKDINLWKNRDLVKTCNEMKKKSFQVHSWGSYYEKAIKNYLNGLGVKKLLEVPKDKTEEVYTLLKETYIKLQKEQIADRVKYAPDKNEYNLFMIDIENEYSGIETITDAKILEEIIKKLVIKFPKEVK